MSDWSTYITCTLHFLCDTWYTAIATDKHTEQLFTQLQTAYTRNMQIHRATKDKTLCTWLDRSTTGTTVSTRNPTRRI